MHKLCKRALSLALTLCLLLSVIPAVSADTPTEITYSFKGNRIGSSLSEQEYLQNRLETTYASGKNYYTLATASTSSVVSWDKNYLKIGSTKLAGYWAAFVVNVPVSGYYNMSSQIGANKSGKGFPMIDICLLDISNKAAITALNGERTPSITTDFTSVMGGTANSNLQHYPTTSGTGTTYAYLGNTYLTAGDYILLINPRTDDTSFAQTTYISNVKLTPGEDGAAFVQQVSNAAGDGSAQVEHVYQLGADLYAPNADLKLCAQDLALNGHKLTVNTVYSTITEGNDTLKNNGIISGLSGEGVVVAGQRPMLPYGGQQTSCFNAGGNTYVCATPATTSGAPFTGKSFMKNPNNVGFAFQIDLPDSVEAEVKAAAAKGGSELKVSMEWTFGDQVGKTVEFSGDWIKKWGAGEGDTFYVEIADINSLVTKYGEVVCTPSITVGTTTTYGKPISQSTVVAPKVLFVGNSFSGNTALYSTQIMNNLGMNNVKVAYLYNAGCSMEDHCTFIKNADLPYDSSEPDENGGDTAYTYYTYVDGVKTTTTKTNAFTGLLDENWDYIVLQQNSGNSGKADSYDCLDELIGLVKESCPNAKLLWNMTWAYNVGYSSIATSDDQLDMYNRICSAAQTKVKPNQNIVGIMPVGTAVQNARTALEADTLYRDGAHLSEPLGCYIAGVAFVESMNQLAALGLDVSELTYAPSGVTEQQRAIAIESALNAWKTPYAVTNSTNTVN